MTAVEKAIEKLIDRCNLVGDNVEIYHEMNRYKALREATSEERAAAYDAVVKILGF